MMYKAILKIAFGGSLCLMVSGCGIRDTTFYIPVDNQKGDAKPLSKEDVVRVVVTRNYLEIPPPQNSQAG